ncbi:MAG: hypothetical protein ABIN37_04940 [Burkholderiaceae bacterium]
MSGSKLSDASPHRAEPVPIKSVDQPLGLTVHALPHVEDAGLSDVRRTMAGRWKMLAVLLICAAPVIASYVTYYLIRPDARRVYGDLVEPQRPLPDLVARALDGRELNLRSLQGQWLLLSVAGAACDMSCERQLYLQRQIREGLGKEKDRLDRVWLIDDTAAIPERLLPALRDATVLRLDRLALARWLVPAAQQALPDHLYLVDPLGNWMMRFPATMDLAAAARAKRDIERVLRASASWDTAGRPAAPP